MIQTIEMFKTNDGELFKTEEKAVAHVENKCCESVQKLLYKGLDEDGHGGEYSRSDIYYFIMALTGTRERAGELSETIDKIV